MKKQLLILIIGLFASSLYAQNTCNIIDEYQKIFKIEKHKFGDKFYLIKKVNQLDKNTCFAELVNKNNQYINYLLTNFSDNSSYEELMSIEDSVKLQNSFIKKLQNDTIFNETMSKLTQKQTSNTLFVPDTVSIDDLLNIAVKYFSITKINKEGYYSGKVCTGINGLKQTEKERKAQIEAFCFATILSNYQGEKFNMYNEFVKAIKELYKVNLGIKNDEKLLRAQGAMYMMMRNNQKLKELLVFEYQNKKNYLPFVLKQ